MPTKTALISGASGNLGMGVADYFLHKGWKVAGCVHRRSSRETNENYSEFEADLFDEEAAAKAAAEAAAHFGHIDTAVLTAGGFAMGNLENTSIADFEFQFRLNFATAYNLARPLLKHMKERGKGSLFFVGSLPGMDTRKAKAVVAYALSKSLLFQLTNIINAETKGQDIKAYVVVPSTIDTPQNRQAVPDADFAKWEKPDEIAAIISRYATNTDKEDKSILVVQDEIKG